MYVEQVDEWPLFSWYTDGQTKIVTGCSKLFHADLHLRYWTGAALSAQSSANRKSRKTVPFTLVIAWSLLRLNRLPSILYLMLIPTSLSWMTSVSMTTNIMLNKVGASTHLCLTPCDWKCFRVLTIIQYSGHHTIMKLTHHHDESLWTSKFGHNPP